MTCQDALDWWDNDKGYLCFNCGRHWCGYRSCSADKGKIEVDDDGVVWCGDCWVEKVEKNEKVDKS
jgi:hypothetical protein